MTATTSGTKIVSPPAIERKYRQALDQCRALGSTNPAQALKAGYRALDLAKQISRKEEASTLAHIAYLLSRHERSDEADQLIEQALRIATTLHDAQALARICGSRAAIYNNQGKPLAALRYYVRALRAIAQGTSAHAAILDGLGQSLHQLGRAAEASEYLMRAIEIYEALPGGSASASSYGAIASIYLELGDLKRARQSLRKSELVAKRAHDRVNMCSVLLAFGELEWQSGHVAAALPLLRRAERMALSLGVQRDYGYALSLQAECARLQQKPEQAITIADRVLETADPEDAVLNRMTLMRRGDAMSDLKRYREAGESYREAAKRTLGNTEVALELSRKIASCHAATANFRQAYLELGKHVGDSLKSNRKQLSRVIVVERELTKLRSHAKRERILREQEETRRAALRESLREVERQRKEIIRLEARAYAPAKVSSIAKVERTSLLAIASIHPKLTPTELRICDLIRKAVATKEIASLIGSSVRTVEWHRASIRRKLELPRRESLELRLMRTPQVSPPF
jgi:tetratricopeptide (TPR) repeat protein/DNA-binding CsgD family transcriptional regulator